MTSFFYKVLLSVLFLSFLVACANNPKQHEKEASTETKQEESSVAEKESNSLEGSEGENIKGEEESISEKGEEESTSEKEEVADKGKSYLTKAEFESLFNQLSDETQYPNGKFELNDGSIVNADHFSYEENDLFYYASAIFFEEKLASIQIETEKSEEEIEKAFGIYFDDQTLVEKNRIGYEITFNEKFNESNIRVYPNEWE